LPEAFSAGDASLDQLTALNEGVLSLVLDQLRARDLSGLYGIYYDWTRRLIEADLQRAPAHQISLVSLYASARISLAVIGDHVGRGGERLMLAYAKLTAQLMMLVGQAYSDSREAYLQRIFEQINSLSHELRAPLSHLFSYLESLRAGDFGAVSPEQDRVLGELMHETDDVLWLLTGTLDVSRLDTGRVDVRIEQFVLASVLNEVVHSTPHPNIDVTCSVPVDLPLLRTDRVKVKQIVGNLLRNAVRYGAGRPVAITATLPRPGMVEVDVRDHGPGIAPQRLQVIFDFFERGDAAGLARDGYGIGLHVVRRLVRLLGGTIEVESTPREGSCFRIAIPITRPEPAQPVAGT
jgi:signal transduction histidine kinase